jgi:predicted nucleotidyltransferase
MGLETSGSVWDSYTGNLKWLPEATAYLTVHGSHAYGTSTPTSDVDLRGWCIPPRRYYFAPNQRFADYTQAEPDLTVYELRKFVHLASQCNPNVIEVLFTDPKHHRRVLKPAFAILEIRDLFITKRAKHTFSGYAASQLKRIRRHWRWLKNPPAAQPERTDFGLPERSVIPRQQLQAAEAAIRKQLDEWSTKFLDDIGEAARLAVTQRMTAHLAEIEVSMDDNAWIGAARTIGYSDNFIELLDRERRYQSKAKDWRAYQEWLANRNHARAELEAKHGYDTKHAMHLVRLLRMAREILTTGKVIVFRPDAEELLAIRNGAWEYERLVEWAECEDAALADLYESSPLPRAPDVKRIDEVVVNLIDASSRP